MTPAGIYIHIPFCERKCRYCDFYSVDDPQRREVYLAAVRAEIRRRRCPSIRAVDSIYFGGGTPSLLPPDFFAHLLEALYAAFPVEEDIEVTLEVNPGTLNPRSMADYRRAGINRVNLGVQSFDDRHLRFLGRMHSATQAREAIAMARRAGFENLGIDLIYGLPDQRLADWLETLDQVRAHAPTHLACYALTYEPDTPLMADRLQGGHRPAGDATLAALFETTAAALCAAGYDHYEISNFAIDRRHRSRHNLKYWTRKPYVGFGPAAHSFLPPQRRWNAADLDGYLERMAQGGLPEEESETLDPTQEMIETVFLGLRLAAGIDLGAFARRHGTPLETRAERILPSLLQDGYLTHTPARLAPTLKGMLFHDSLSAMLTERL